MPRWRAPQKPRSRQRVAFHATAATALAPKGLRAANGEAEAKSALIIAGLTQCMVRPCVARGFRRSGGRAVLHQCIRLLIGACCAPYPTPWTADASHRG